MSIGVFSLQRLFLDCEFTNFGGDLISLALVPEVGTGHCYIVLDSDQYGWPSPFVKQHILTNLQVDLTDHGRTLTREVAARHVANYLHAHVKGDEALKVMADWPEDLSHFLRLFGLGDGRTINIPAIDLEYRRIPGFATATHSSSPHNALFDAVSLREFMTA